MFENPTEFNYDPSIRSQLLMSMLFGQNITKLDDCYGKEPGYSIRSPLITNSVHDRCQKAFVVTYRRVIDVKFEGG